MHEESFKRPGGVFQHRVEPPIERNASVHQEFHPSEKVWKRVLFSLHLNMKALCFGVLLELGILETSTHQIRLLIPTTNLPTNRGTHQDQAWSRSRWMGTSPPSPEGSAPLKERPMKSYEPVNLRRFIEIHSAFSCSMEIVMLSVYIVYDMIIIAIVCFFCVLFGVPSASLQYRTCPPRHGIVPILHHCTHHQHYHGRRSRGETLYRHTAESRTSRIASHLSNDYPLHTGGGTNLEFSFTSLSIDD